ncbi:patatin-like phospholipase family protein [Ramlibacter albus]|uniref:Patatin-like phospholipase family protein n=1 Tax=Ramlibacter albus TaxID=2079448 RepID=A0A923S082_9BURK|nr:patatin-like phospholipase family protein [Ramlibacter albus]MBC5763069.1 patatin-like phospholipase family protein [Ramlibacter albus]
MTSDNERQGTAAAPASPDPTGFGIVLTGGGARAAYQVGVLLGILRIRRELGAPSKPPFDIYTGTSAGAINAAILASRADDFDAGVAHLFDMWRRIDAGQVYRTDASSLIRNAARWVAMFALGWALPDRWRRQPRSLLDNAPLERLLARNVRFNRLHEMVSSGQVRALAIGASSYSTGWHVTFFEGDATLQPWLRSQRMSQRTELMVAHLLASSAIPFVFPATQAVVQGRAEWLGDGTMRETAPIAPAIHLGARRLLVIGSDRRQESSPESPPSMEYPSLARVAGHALSSIFLDALATDVERASRINQALQELPERDRDGKPRRTVELLLIAPSLSLDEIAAKHVASLPRTIRALLSALGAACAHEPGQALASYLLFQAPFTRELMTLGEADALQKRDQIVRFFGWSIDKQPASQGSAPEGKTA